MLGVEEVATEVEQVREADRPANRHTLRSPPCSAAGPKHGDLQAKAWQHWAIASAEQPHSAPPLAARSRLAPSSTTCRWTASLRA